MNEQDTSTDTAEQDQQDDQAPAPAQTAAERATVTQHPEGSPRA